MNDDELREHFDALRELDASKLPRFESRRIPNKSLGWLAVPLVLAAVIVLVLVRIDEPPPRTLLPLPLASSEPLAFLLRPIPPLEAP